MSYQVLCACGQVHAVEESSAGATLPCKCGRSVPVPALSTLRRQAGQAAYQPRATLLIEHLLAAGELPPLGCACCDVPTEEVVNATAQCERSQAGPTGAEVVARVLLFLFIGFWSFLLYAGREPAFEGENRFVRMPLRLCPACRRMFLPRRWVPNLAWLKIVLLVLGLMLLALGSMFGLLLLAMDGLLILLQVWQRQQRQRERKRIWRQVPVYDQLFDEFPEAEIALGTD